jgi:hypothetical protein
MFQEEGIYSLGIFSMYSIVIFAHRQIYLYLSICIYLFFYIVSQNLQYDSLEMSGIKLIEVKWFT